MLSNFKILKYNLFFIKKPNSFIYIYQLSDFTFIKITIQSIKKIKIYFTYLFFLQYQPLNSSFSKLSQKFFVLQHNFKEISNFLYKPKILSFTLEGVGFRILNLKDFQNDLKLDIGFTHLKHLKINKFSFLKRFSNNDLSFRLISTDTLFYNKYLQNIRQLQKYDYYKSKGIRFHYTTVHKKVSKKDTLS